MNREQISAIVSLRSDGYAVIVWSPEELDEVSARLVENRSIELGHQIIDDLTEGCGILEMLTEEQLKDLSEDES